MDSSASAIVVVSLTIILLGLELKQYGSASATASAAFIHDYGEPLMSGHPHPNEDDENNFIDNNNAWDTVRRANRFNMDNQGGPPRLDNRVRFDEVLKPRPRCDKRIRIANGVTRVRDKGTLVRFQCSFGFHMLGAGVAVCVRGQWSDPPPTCVREGCRTMPIPLHGSLRQLYGGGVAVFSCNYGFLLDGERILTCDGQKWNGTAPTCVEIPPITIAPPITTYSPPPVPEPLPGSGTPSPVPTAPGETLIPSTNASEIIPPIPTILEIPTQENTTIPAAKNENEINPTVEIPVVETTTLTSQIIDETTGAPMASPTPFLVPQPIETTPMTTITTIPVTTDLAKNDTSESTVIPTTAEPEIVTKDAQDTNSEVTTTTVTVSSEISTTSIPPTFTKKFKPTKPIKPTKPPKSSKPFEKTTTTETSTSPPQVEPAPEPKPETEKPTMIIYTDPTQPSMSPPRALNPIPIPTPRDDFNEAPLHPIVEKVEIIPEKLGNSHEDDEHDARINRYDFGHLLVVVGITLIAIGLVTIAGGVFTYYWRKHKGIAHPNSYDLDGRTLSTNDGNDEFLWVDNRGDRDSGGL